MKKYTKIVKLKSKEKVYLKFPKKFIEDSTHIDAIASINTIEPIEGYCINEISCNAKCYLQEDNIVCEVTGLYRAINIEGSIKNGSLKVKVDILLLKENEFDSKNFKPIPINQLETLK